MKLSLSNKLDLLLIEDRTLIEFDDLLNSSLNGFKSKFHLSQYLSEGALLNVGVLASKALSVPCGEYMVWMTDAGHTMLVPTADGKSQKEVYESSSQQYDIFTNTLLQNWNKLSRTLSEDKMPDQFKKQNEKNQEQTDSETDGEGISMKIDASTVDRKPILRAMEDRGFTVTSLANAVGVDPPAISRILRTPKNKQGDPGGRNPSMGLASQVCTALRLDPTAAFPDIFGDKSKYKPRSNPGNRGSGMGGAAGGSKRKGKASEKWTKGNND